MPEATAYATVAQLVKVLKVDRTANEADLIRVLQMAAKEIDSEIGGIAGGWSDDPQALSLLQSVNLRRAEDIWEFEKTSGVAGILGLGTETPLIVSRNSWERYANELAPLKTEWGFA